MAHPMTCYLLELATDSNELTKFNNAHKDVRTSMGVAKGLGAQQAADLASGDSTLIMNDVLTELNIATPYGGTHYTIQLALVIQPCKKT
jgi:hypothetical protein